MFVTSLLAESTTPVASRVTSLILVALLVAVLVIGFRWLLPHVRRRRHQAWERAGLLPEQLDRTPPQDRSDFQ